MIVRADAESIELAVAALRRGACIGLPTETVYGLAGDGLNPRAVARIFEIKRRPAFDPLILHVSGTSDVPGVARRIPELARRLMEHFWPGPLTLVLPRHPAVPDLVTSGLETVAVRCPAHPVARAVLEAFAGPLAAPSANPFGRLSPTTAQAVEEELGDALALVLDGGPCQRGIESTIVDCSEEVPVLLRDGAISREELVPWTGTLRVGVAGEKIKAPGLLAHHYAPRTPLWILSQPLSQSLTQDPGLGSTTGLVMWSDFPVHAGPVRVLSPGNDPLEAATRLFSILRELDGLYLHRLVVEPVPLAGVGRAVQDRLFKASAGVLAREGAEWLELPR